MHLGIKLSWISAKFNRGFSHVKGLRKCIATIGIRKFFKTLTVADCAFRHLCHMPESTNLSISKICFCWFQEKSERIVSIFVAFVTRGISLDFTFN